MKFLPLLPLKLSGVVEIYIDLLKGVCSLDGYSQALMDEFMASRGNEQYLIS